MKKEIYSGIVFAFLSAPLLGSEEIAGDVDSTITVQAEVRPPDFISIPKAESSDSGTPISSEYTPYPDIYVPPSGRDTFVTTRVGFPDGMTGFTEPSAPDAPPPVDVKKCCGWW